MTMVLAQHADTLDTIAFRYYNSLSVAMLPALIDANPHLSVIFMAENTRINLPASSLLQQNQSLKLWD